jgi:hypothetical protein
VVQTCHMDNIWINIFDGLPKKKHVGDSISYYEQNLCFCVERISRKLDGVQN